MPLGPEGNDCKAGKMEGLALPSAQQAEMERGWVPASARKAVRTCLLSPLITAVTCAPGHPDKKKLSSLNP